MNGIKGLSLSILLSAGLLQGFAETKEPVVAAPVAAPAADASKGTVVLLKTSMGDIKVELADKEAPITVKNFLQYVDSGYYKGTVFHRVIKNFMSQGGGFTEDLKQKKTLANIQNEANNGLKNEKYTLAMARTPSPHSASSQFFINAKNNTFLNFKSEKANGWGYCVFGKVIEGKDIADKINAVKTGPKGRFRSDVPKEAVSIIDVVRVK